MLGEEVTFGLGFTPTTPRRPFGPNPSAFGHFGTGGAVGFADPDAGVAFGYAMNHVIPRWQSQPEPGPDRRPLLLPLTSRASPAP